MSVPNQIIIVVEKEKTGKAYPYSCINLEAYDYAAIHCNTVGSFKLWCYLAKNQHGYQFELSRTAFCAWSGLSATAYHNAIKLLKEQGFLVQSEEQKNKYIFYELPTKEKMGRTEEDYIIEIPEEKVIEQKKMDQFYF